MLPRAEIASRVRASAETKKAVVVLGMHRSGTSALARSLSFYGFALPVDLMKPQPDNPKGFWESVSVMRLNEEILAALGSNWREAAPWHIPGRTLAEAKAQVTEAVRQRWLQKAVAVLREGFGDAPAIVVKDPRVSLFLPMWRDAFSDAGYEPHFVLIHRNPLDVASSLRQRNEMAHRAGLQLWQRYVLASLDPANGVAIDAVVAYENLIEAPHETMDALVGRLGEPKHKSVEARGALDEFIAVSDRHHASSVEVFEASAIVSEQVKQAWALLRGWDTTPPKSRARKTKELWGTFRESMLMCGPLKPVRMPSAATTIVQTVPRDTEVPPKIQREDLRPVTAPAPIKQSNREERRKGAAMLSREPEALEKADLPEVRPDAPTEPPLILHYHLFKNAGTSVDEMLRRNFGDRWEEKEFSTPLQSSNVGEVEIYLGMRPELQAFSSHTATLPLPRLNGRGVFPIIFLRHPIGRLKSAYSFERQQDADTFGARLAKEQDFAGYLRELLANPARRQARNFQTYRLAFGQAVGGGTEIDRATATLATLPFCGLVEDYALSLEKLENLLQPVFPDFAAVAVQKNMTESSEHSLEEKLDRIAQELGPELGEAVWAANADDIRLFEMVMKQYDSNVAHRYRQRTY